jgi:hypothetical protein
MWRARVGRSFGPVVRQTTKWMNETFLSWIWLRVVWYVDMSFRRNLSSTLKLDASLFSETSVPSLSGSMILGRLENCVLLGYNTANSGNSLPTFRDSLILRLSKISLDRLSRNVGKELPLFAAW